MKVLWIINSPTADISKQLNRATKDSTGWLTGYLNEIRKSNDIDLTIAFPLLGEKQIISGKIDGIAFYSFYQKSILKKYGFPHKKISDLAIMQLKEIIRQINPDIMHIFGSEYNHSLHAAKIFDNPERTLVHIQGLVSVISNHYYSGLPSRVIKKFAFSNLIRGNIKSQKNKFAKRGKYEIELIKFVNHVNGRTDWDETCVKRMNSDIKYHFCNESLRDLFYQYEWGLEKCNRNTIFMSQASYPIKGIHFIIEALSDIVKKYPDVKLYVAGNNFINTSGLVNKLKVSSYGLYIKKMISKYKLDNNIVFTGFLSEKDMVQQLLSANVFVSGSVIENSPNSLSEAMLIGMPIVTSDVGGTKNLFKHGIDGYTYQYDAPYMLANYVCKLFEDDELSKNFAYNARQHAKEKFDKIKNSKDLLEIYSNIHNSSR